MPCASERWGSAARYLAARLSVLFRRLDRNAQVLQVLSGPDARLHQELGGVDGGRRHDDLAPRLDGLHPVEAVDLHADRAPVADHHAARNAVHKVAVHPTQGGTQIGPGGGPAARVRGTPKMNNKKGKPG